MIMLKGYTSNDVKLYENDVRNFPKSIQYKRIKILF